MQNNFTRTPVTLAIGQCLAHSPARQKPAMTRGLLATLMALSISSPVIADTFTVSNTQDSGAGSLREAITLANTNPGKDIVELSSVSGDISTVTDLPGITDDLNIIGPGPDVLAISSPLIVSATTVYSQIQVNISGLKTTGITATHTIIPSASVNTFGSTFELTVANSIIANGSGVTIGDGGSIVLNNSLITGNDVGFSFFGNSGRRNFSDEHLKFSNTTITGNTVAGSFFPGTGGNTITLDNCSITKNGSGITGHASSLSISNSVFSENGTHAIDLIDLSHSAYRGFFPMSVNITDSIIKNNQGDGVKIHNRNEALELVLSNSTIESNSGSGISHDTNSYSGGSLHFSIDMKIHNSTISSNNHHGINFYSFDAASALQLGIENSTINYNNGIGIRFRGHTGLINNTTITGNREGGNINSKPVENFYAESTNDLKLTNTIIAGNTFAGSYDLGGTTAVTAQNSLIQNPDTLVYPDQIPGENLIGVDPLLGPLSDNGGATKTHALLTGSPAIDAADNASCTSLDQRGISRPQDGDADGSMICDIGAYEFNMTSPVPSMSLDVNVNDQSALKPGPLISSGSATNWTYTVTNTGSTSLNNIEITGRQKLPSLENWKALCSIDTIQPGTTGTCSTTDTATSETYKALIIARGAGAGDKIEASSQAFYFGQSETIDPGLLTKRNIALGVLEAKSFDATTHTALLTEINAATSVSELHTIIVRMRSGTTGSDPRLDAKRNIALGVFEAKGFDATTHATLLAEINAATSVSELHTIIVRMRLGTVATTPQLALSLAVTAAGSAIEKPGASIPAGSTVNWTYTVTNEGNAPLHNILITQRQKLPSLGEWETPCSFTTLAPGATESCSATTTAITDNYKALIVARSTLDNSDNIEDKVDAFYRH